MTVEQLSRKTVRVAGAAALGASVVGVAGLVGSAPASAGPPPPSGYGCTNAGGDSNVICIHIEGSGRYVSYFSGTLNDLPGYTGSGHFELHGPTQNNNSALLRNGPTSNISTIHPYRIFPSGNYPSGAYCNTLWKNVGSGYSDLGSGCANIHS